MNAIISVTETPIRQLNGLYSLNDLHRAAGGKTDTPHVGGCKISKPLI